MNLLHRELGPLVNMLIALAGAALGLLFRSIPDRIRTIVLGGIGLSVILIGLSMALEKPDLIVVTLGMAFGGLVGEVLHLEDGFQQFGRILKGRFSHSGHQFAEGFTLAVLVWCVGPLSIMGALASGLRGNPQLLYAKSILDGITAIFFSSAFGPGVLAAALAVGIYEGTVAALAAFVAPLLTPLVLSAFTTTGGLIIVAIGLNTLGVTHLRVSSFLPALVVAPLVAIAKQHLHLAL